MANNTTNTNNKKHDFGKKASEQGKQTYELPTFKTAEKKAIELIESEIYGLEDSDFWILKNNTKNGGLAYSNLIISHNGCLKINDKLPPEKQFKSEYLGEIEPSPFGGGFIMKYDDGVLREYGEVSSANCKNPYPVAMLLKRVMDRVILKKSGIAYAGIYSEVESDEFKATIDDEPTVQINEETGEVIEKKPVSKQAKAPQTTQAVAQAKATKQTVQSSVVQTSQKPVQAQTKPATTQTVASKPATPTQAKPAPTTAQTAPVANGVTERQRTTIANLKNDVGISDENMRTLIKNITSKGRLIECTRKEASDVIDFLIKEKEKVNTSAPVAA